MSWGRRSDVFGVECFTGSLESATELVIQAGLNREGGYACLCNVHVIETARRDPSVMSALRAARIVFPDGAPIAWVQRLQGGKGERVGGPDLMNGVIRDGRHVGLRHALYGSTDSTLAALMESLHGCYPGVQIVKAIAPPVGRDLETSVDRDLEDLRSSRPHVVWIALGAPRQELWAARHAAALAPAIVIGVGAAFDFLAGTKPRAPIWMQRAGLEWLHRVATEPRRLSGRYVVTNSRFTLRAAVKGIRHVTRQGPS